MLPESHNKSTGWTEWLGFFARSTASLPALVCLSFRIGASAISLALIFDLDASLSAEANLLERSPFLPPGYGVKEVEPEKPTVQPQGQISRELEFRGIVRLNGKFQFSIFNKKDQQSYWLSENEADQSGISVRSYDPNSSSILVNMNGRTERLTMAEQTDSPMPVAQSKPTPPAQIRPPNLPAQLRNNNAAANNRNNRREVPRRRVILPKKTN